MLLANGDKVPYDRLLIATGVRSRPWFNPEEAKLKGVFTLRTSDDAAELQAALDAGPKRVLIVGAGFIGSEMASVCRELGLDVTVAERADAPLVGALGGVIGEIAAEMQRDAGVDLRTGVAVEALEGDADGHVRRAKLSDGTTLDVDVVVASLGSIRNIEWLEGAGLATGFWGVACDAGCRAFDINGVVTDNIFVAGDIARAPHVLYEYQFLSMEHWDNAVLGGQIAAHNMVSLETGRRPHLPLPRSGPASSASTSRASACAPSATRSCSPRARVEDRRFAAAYGRRGRIVGAVTFNHGKWLEYYARDDRAIGAVPAAAAGLRPAGQPEPMPARFPDPRVPTGIPDVVLTGHDPTVAGRRVPPPKPANDARLPNEELHHDTAETAWAEAMRYENRANPYPFFDELRKTPVARVADDIYVVTGYRELTGAGPRPPDQLRHQSKSAGGPDRRAAAPTRAPTTCRRTAASGA